MSAAATASTPIWTAADDRRLRVFILAMFSFPKVLAEFPEHGANAVRAAWERLFYEDGQSPLDRALYVLADRARYCHRSATGLRLDARPASAAQIVAAANTRLSQLQLPPIRYVAQGGQ